MNKMFSKMLLLLSFLINIFNSTFCIPQELVKLIGGLHPRSEQYKTNINNISVNLWAGLCEDSFQYLRSSFVEYRDLYVDYTLFNETNKKCGLVVYTDGRKQPTVLLNCHGRPSAIPDNVFPSYIKYNNELAILPVVNIILPTVPNTILNKVYIYKYEKDANIYIRIAQHDLGNPRSIPNILFERLPPVIEKTYIFDETVPISVKQIIPTWKKSEMNVLNTIELNEFVKLCVWMFGQERFKSEFNVISKSDEYGGQKSVEKTFVDIKATDIDGLVFTDVYICKGTYIGPIIITETEPVNVQYYALAVADMVDTVIVCKNISQTLNVEGVEYPLFHALELVKNINEKYLKDAP